MSRTITGLVSSDKGDKTIVVKTAMTKTHPVYKKQYKRNRRFMAHDEKNEAKTGDLVIIRETRPLSAKKRFVLEKIVEKATSGFKEDDVVADIPVEQLEKVAVENDAADVGSDAKAEKNNISKKPKKEKL